MLTRQRHIFEAVSGAATFLEDNQKALDGIVTPTARRNLAACRERFLEYMTTQEEYLRVVAMRVSVKQALRDRLVRAHLLPIAIYGRAKLSSEPGLAAIIGGSRRQRYMALIAAAHGVAAAAEGHKQALIDAGLPPDFIERLRVAAEALEQAVTDHGLAVAARVKARAGLRAESREARMQLRILDTQIRGALDPDDPLLGQWSSVRHIRRRAATAKPASEPRAPGLSLTA